MAYEKNKDSGFGRDFSEHNKRFVASMGGIQQQERKMHKVTCSSCGNETEVPFEPKEGRPVFCKDCYRKKKNGEQ